MLLKLPDRYQQTRVGYKNVYHKVCMASWNLRLTENTRDTQESCHCSYHHISPISYRNLICIVFQLCSWNYKLWPMIYITFKRMTKKVIRREMSWRTYYKGWTGGNFRRHGWRRRDDSQHFLLRISVT